MPAIRPTYEPTKLTSEKQVLVLPSILYLSCIDKFLRERDDFEYPNTHQYSLPKRKHSNVYVSWEHPHIC